jgi:hypothetical protein
MGTLLMVGTLLLLCFVLCYGLMLDWFHSSKIQAATVGILVLLILFIQRSVRVKRPVLSLEALSSWKVISGLALLFFLCLLFNTGNLNTTFLTIILRDNPLQSAYTAIFAIPGYIFGSLLCFLYYRRYMNFLGMAVLACVFFLFANMGMLHLTAATTGSYDLFWPIFFRASAAIITYISIGIYIAGNITPRHFGTVISALIAIRTLFAPMAASCLYSNWLYKLKIKHVNNLALTMDRLNPFLSERRASLYGSVNQQASLLALHDIYAALVIFTVILLAVVLVFPFHGTQKRIVFNWQDPLHIKEAAQSITI